MRANTAAKRFALTMLLLIVAFAPMWGCQPKEKKKNSAASAIPVKISRVELIEFEQTLDYAGDVKAQDEVVVYPKVSGKVIEKIGRDGDSVQKGTTIAYIDRDEVGLKYEYAPVESPLEGTLGRVYVDIGTSVTPQTPVALVVSMDKMKIDLDVPEIYLPKVMPGQKARVFLDAYPNEEFIGTVAKVSPVVDLNTRSAPAEITLDNPGHRIKSGMFAKVSLVVEKIPEVPVVLKESVIGTDPDYYVYVVENKKAVLKRVSLGLRQGPYFQVTAGLNRGEQVVVMGQQRLYEGASVETGE